MQDKMKVCSDGHNEICFIDDYCPCCEALSESEELDCRVSELETDVEDLERELTEVNDYNAALEAEVEELREGE